MKNSQVSKNSQVTLKTLNNKLENCIINHENIVIQIHTDNLIVRHCFHPQDVQILDHNVCIEGDDSFVFDIDKIDLVEYDECDNSYYIKFNQTEVYVDFINVA